MNQKILFFAAIVLITIAGFVVHFTHEAQSGTVKEVTYGNNKITIFLEEYEEPFVLFTNELLDISKGDSITITGVENTYRGRDQVIVQKLTKEV